MAFPLSPVVNWTEIDLSTIVPAVGTAVGAFVGNFNWGPIDDIMFIDNELTLIDRVFKPDNANFVDFFTAANFLAYTDSLRLVRSANTSVAKNATADTTGLIIKNEGYYIENYFNGEGSVGAFAARYAGDLGNSLRVSVCPSSNAFNAAMVATASSNTGNSTVVFSANAAADVGHSVKAGDFIKIGASDYFVEVLTVSSDGLNVTVNNSTLLSNVTANTVVGRWRYFESFGSAPSTSAYAASVNGINDELHVIVIDRQGKFSGQANTTLEKYSHVSKAIDAINSDGTSNYYRNVLFDKSRYVYWMDHIPEGTNWGSTANGITFTAVNKSDYFNLSGGVSSAPTIAQIMTSYDLFKYNDRIDVSLVMTAGHGTTVATYVINNITEYRKDAVAFVNTDKADVVNNAGNEVRDVSDYRNNLPSSSYSFGVIDNWKYQFDKYNNVYRWVPLDGDVAGLVARTEQERDAWWSPAGLNRGQIKNVTKIAWYSSKSHRDALYPIGINSIVSFPNEGTVLWGDKTLLSKPSAFDRINVRRLFIVLEKAISRAAKYTLFEFNDEFTRAAFINLVEPFLRDVQGRRGIQRFKVKCDETNNPPSVISRNEFVADIYILPNYSINFIQLNFIAVNNEAQFNTKIGQV
jgi:hypothetical protein